MKPGTCQNELKPAETTKKKLRNDPKRPKITKLGKSRIFC